jgi:6,7-dimethyl-8-ribityllumazine synthase
MPRTIEGDLVAEGLTLAIICSRWNHFIADRLLEGALDTFRRHGGDTDNVTIIKVPGSFEIPMAAEKVASSGDYDAVVCLGALIRGATPHFDYIASECTKGIANASMKSGVPVSYGVITTDTLEQAIERAGTKAGNKGGEAALAAIEMANLYEELGT